MFTELVNVVISSRSWLDGGLLGPPSPPCRTDISLKSVRIADGRSFHCACGRERVLVVRGDWGHSSRHIHVFDSHPCVVFLSHRHIPIQTHPHKQTHLHMYAMCYRIVWMYYYTYYTILYNYIGHLSVKRGVVCPCRHCRQRASMSLYRQRRVKNTTIKLSSLARKCVIVLLYIAHLYVFYSTCSYVLYSIFSIYIYLWTNAVEWPSLRKASDCDVNFK